MGKTSIVLAALNDLIFDSFEVSKVLIIAPLRVAKHTWSTEIQKWDQLKGLRYSISSRYSGREEESPYGGCRYLYHQPGKHPLAD